MPGKILSKFYILQTRTANLQDNYFGLGVDEIYSQAIIKSYVEYIERTAFFKIGIDSGFTSTNGFAGHVSEKLAQKSACDEVCERDSFLLHWYSKTAFLQIEEVKSLSADIFELKGMGYEVSFHKTYLGFQDCYVCFIYNKKTYGFVVGLSSGKSTDANIIKSFTEAVVNLFLGSYTFTDAELEENFKNFGFDSLSAHRFYWLKKRALPHWIFDKPRFPNKTTIVNIVPAITDKIFYTHKEITVVGLNINETIPLEVGFASERTKQLLFKRLGIDMSATDLALCEPHPIP